MREEIDQTDLDLQRVANVVACIAKRHEVSTSFTATLSLVDAGMSSVAMVELMLAVESEFDLTIPDRDLSAENFSSISTLTTLVTRLTTKSASQPRASQLSSA